ncbi:hypothetical protein EC881467_4668 [Escherichia coli 88.1467]|nr:hypothetical protein ECDEC3B_4531 [Escherichia coli DEC3B]EIN19396.1 hypothetical protein ECFDA505_4532 [Escherichia coli FDA505]EIN35458.1 hypothetical protein EC93001_4692 [Escherichia coli 93-001]EIN51242.1 hypothetical protein ECPA3_4706 [Escherichia coli PA3]EIN54287.1 hypothetical protein ECPA5_4565 [Escherichia coli PA5]EIN72025.1 hypothetical protein ECPA14_4731 [Escherichia coli PA14]EIO25863.1 hypothetical protein ECPA40_4739 [Escherichia coli PA40]EIO33454.1 hypothetical protei
MGGNLSVANKWSGFNPPGQLKQVCIRTNNPAELSCRVIDNLPA